MTPAQLQIIEESIQAGCNIVLALATLVYVVLTKRISDASVATVKQIFKQQRPAIVMKVGTVTMSRFPHAIEFEVINVGAGPALALVISYFDSGMAMTIAEGAHISFLSGTVGEKTNIGLKLEEQRGWTPPSVIASGDFVLGIVECSYSDIHGEKYVNKFELYVDEFRKVQDRVTA